MRFHRLLTWLSALFLALLAAPATTLGQEHTRTVSNGDVADEVVLAYRDTIARLGPAGMDIFYLDNAATAAEVERCWQLIQRSTVAYLDRHPLASPDGLIAHVLSLNPSYVLSDDWTDQRTNDGGPRVETFRLWGNAVLLRSKQPRTYVVAVNFDGVGTFFVIQQKADGSYEVAWDVKPVAKEHHAKRDQLGYWAHTLAGIGDGPLVAQVHPLPPTAAGTPRFWVIGRSRSAMGGTGSNQIGVWEWTGSEAKPKLIDCYARSFGTGYPTFDGTFLKIPIKASLRHISTCGGCDDPRATLTWEITDSDVIDHGREFDDWLLPTVDDVMRAAVDASSSDFATAEVIAKVRNLLVSEEGQPCFLFDNWRVERQGARATMVIDSCFHGIVKIQAIRDGKRIRITEVEHLPRTPYATPIRR